MNQMDILKPDYVFEVSWEVCNKVGGIYTVVSTKAPVMKKEYGDNFILIGPDVWKETRGHPEFDEDTELFAAWKEKAGHEGLNIRIGRWNAAGNPIVMLVDFTPFFARKNEIFAKMWESHQLDSLSGQWDYVEPALFGYASALVIQSFYEFYLSSKDHFIAHFHEWMTGMGVLYLREHVPQASTVFTTHATILGRSIAGRGKRLYEHMEILDAESLAQSYGIVSKFSLEKLSANKADSFTTVSEITARECLHFLKRKVDVVAENGFDDSFVPATGMINEKRSEARDQLLKVSSALLGYPVQPDTRFVLNSGRYEFRNKGIDLFIEGLARLNKLEGPPVVAYIAVPANHSGPNRELLASLADPGNPVDQHTRYLTHYLHDESVDPVIRHLHDHGILNDRGDRVKVIFLPAYLDGNDGVFDMMYYDFLLGFDLTVFPSYYEPWGYTPLESTAFFLPTLTTTLAGFGQWVRSENPGERMAVRVVERIDGNENKVVDEICEFINEITRLDKEDVKKIKRNAREISRTALWTLLLKNYQQAYSVALHKSEGRSEQYKDKQQQGAYYLKDISPDQKPVWSKVVVEPAFSRKLEKLQKLSRNIWWTWNYEAEELFESVDPVAWRNTGNNPIAMLESLSSEQLKKLEKDDAFLAKLNSVWESFEEYMAKAKDKPDELVAYFSMEYGLHDTIKIYSGGLGMLAGDYLKEASDSNKNIVGVGLLYRYGYFQQSLSVSGDQVAHYTQQKFSHLPVSPVRDKDGNWLKISIALPGRNLNARAWVVRIGRISLYLLDADLPENQLQDRAVTHQLYGGDWENRFKQELLLGVGGIRLLREIGIKADIYHCNEGHAAFMGLERIRTLVQERSLTFHQAIEVVRASTLFTTHTPVPAGHDAFDENLLRTYIPHYHVRMGLSWDEFIGLGKVNPGNPDEKFSMSVLALKLSQETNGVSRIHGKVSREMFRSVYDGYYPSELHIGHVTNGVHMPTWTGKYWRELYASSFGEEYIHHQSDPSYWEKIYEVDDSRIWEVRNKYRKELVDYLRERIINEYLRKQESPNIAFRMTDKLDEHALTIGFARRFATYKRAHLLFTNLERLSSILNNPDHPVQIVFAGKAHPADKAGQDLIKHIVEISRRPEFVGKIFFVENYDIELARKLLHGVDIWLNTPTRPLEASGTSGEKAVMNGVLNLSVLDGWWAEGFKPGAGWGIQESRAFENQYYQDELDAEIIYDLLEEEILPEFFDRKEGIPVRWIGYVKNTIAGIAPHFTMKRMLDEYQEKYYTRLGVRSRQMKKNNCQLAKEIDRWKTHVAEAWDGIRVTRFAMPDNTRKPLTRGDDFVAEIELDLNGLKPEDIGIDVVFGKKENGHLKDFIFSKELTRKTAGDKNALYTCRIPMERVGVFDIAFRIFPKNDSLPHRQDFTLVRWI